MIRQTLVLLLAVVPAEASAHMRMVTPPPRDQGAANADAHKTAPCGGVNRTAAQKVTTYAPGAKVDVLVEETIDHTGCFKVQLSTANDTGWTTLATVNDPANAGINHDNPATYRKVSIPVTLPAAPCDGCTMRVTQLMLGRACNANDTPEGSSTYYSCANIRIQPGDGGTPDASTPPDASTTVDSGPPDDEIDASGPEPTIEAGAPNDDGNDNEPPEYRPSVDTGGGLSCASARGAPASVGGALALLALVCVVRRKLASSGR
jgi:hypothetical protein